MTANKLQTEVCHITTAGCNPPLLEECNVMHGSTAWHTWLSRAKEEPYTVPALPQCFSPWLWVSCDIFFLNKSRVPPLSSILQGQLFRCKKGNQNFSVFEKFTQTRLMRSTSPLSILCWACNIERKPLKPCSQHLLLLSGKTPPPQRRKKTLYVTF